MLEREERGEERDGGVGHTHTHTHYLKLRLNATRTLLSLSLLFSSVQMSFLHVAAPLSPLPPPPHKMLSSPMSVRTEEGL